MRKKKPGKRTNARLNRDERALAKLYCELNAMLTAVAGDLRRLLTKRALKKAKTGFG